MFETTGLREGVPEQEGVDVVVLVVWQLNFSSC
jgi:hypothetical protein